MNFFRSEEHLRNWDGFSNRKEGGIIAIDALMWLFSGPYFTKRLEPDYMSHYGDYMEQMLSSLDQLKNAGSFWQIGPLEKAGFALGRKMGII
jgi:hypothetical protein